MSLGCHLCSFDGLRWPGSTLSFLVVAGQWRTTSCNLSVYIYIYHINILYCILLHVYLNVELVGLFIYFFDFFQIYLFAPGMLRVSNWTVPKENNSLKDSKVEPIVICKKFIPSLQFLYVKNIYTPPPEVEQFAPEKLPSQWRGLSSNHPCFRGELLNFGGVTTTWVFPKIGVPQNG